MSKLKDSNQKQMWIAEQTKTDLEALRQPGEKLFQTVQRVVQAVKQQGPIVGGKSNGLGPR